MPIFNTDDGVSIHYHVDDFRDPWLPEPEDAVLMTHGFAQSMKWLQGWVPNLARRYRVVRYDIRGYGGSALPPTSGDWSADRLARDALNLIDHLGIPQIHWVGYQSGSLWGMRFAANYPHRISSLTMCTTESATFMLKPPRKEIVSPLIRQMGFKKWAEEVRRDPPTLAMASPEEAAWHRQEYLKTPTEAAAGIRHIVETTDFTGVPAQVRVPALILNGDKSTLCRLDRQYAIWKSFPNARLRVFPNMGDGLVLEIPDRCSQEVLRFLETL